MKKQKRETGKPKVAVAIRYDAAKDDAPRLTAKGQGHVAERIIELARQHKPDVVILDVSMPDLNGIDATQRIREHNREVKIIALSMHSDKRFVGGMLKAGASGYLLKDCAFGELANAIRAVMRDQTYLSPGIAQVVVEGYVRNVTAPGQVAASALTPREREVLQLLAEGKATREIAALLKLSARTVETHRQQIMNKLNLHKAAELVKYAIREGMITLERH